ncbi:hypothetical protein DYU05_19505 [Mucilaginibacter terrenus]|uniref:Uncharacterized protein n=1 Tax=Mucilaginibacter terrenus TaxID=2482727 RepID=A0A3E2NKE1_9SPHI|nr:hypothetical protein [Mucilaginibacter terrenus]RFZ81467.1 hypothetical protein DYU05_19505 [Mucilaginibacter terrenus]
MEQVVLSEDGQSIYFNLLEDWDSFDIIIEVLVAYFSAKVYSKIDMPESRIYKIMVDKANFTLMNDPYGNSLRADNKEADKLIEQIYVQWSPYYNLWCSC